MTEIYPNQRAAAANIHGIFAGGEIHYALLCAEMQSGKTGTFHDLAAQSLSSGLVDRVYILCGSNETVLRQQARAAAADYHPGDKRIRVAFRQDFPRLDMKVRRALLIVDESHLDSSSGQQMQQFLARHGLDLRGTTPAMRTNKTYICSVSATPYAERAKIADGSALPKHVEALVPGAGYFGIGDYAAAGLIRDAFDIRVEEGAAAFRDLLTAQTRSEVPKWILFRSLDDKTITAVRRLCLETGVAWAEYTSKRSDIGEHMERLETAPVITTLVLLKGKCRVGKVVPKRHVAFVWEDSDAPKTDTLVQALPGRMCGYADAFGTEKPILYVPPPITKTRQSVLTLHPGDEHRVSELERHAAVVSGMEVVPLYGANIVGSDVSRVHKMRTFQCPPLRLRLTTPQDTWSSRAALLEYIRASLDQLTEEPNWRLLTGEQQEEILGAIRAPGTEAWTGRRFAVGDGLILRQLKAEGRGASTGMSDYFAEIAAAHEAQTTASESSLAWRSDKEGVEDKSFALLHVVHGIPRDASIAATVGDLYVVFNTYARPRLEAIHRGTRIPETRKDTVFDVAAPAPEVEVDDPAEDPTAAAPTEEMGVRLPAAVSTDPSLLRTFLTPLIALPVRAICFDGGLRLCKAAYHYEGSQKKRNDLIRILRDIEGPLHLKAEWGAGPHGESNMYLKRLTW